RQHFCSSLKKCRRSRKNASAPITCQGSCTWASTSGHCCYLLSLCPRVVIICFTRVLLWRSFPARSTQLVVITNDRFLGAEGKKNEERLVDNAVRMVRDGANDLAIQLRVKDAGHTNFSDSPLFAPGPLRKLQGAGDIDCVTFIDQV
ncbi:unnamed protein product, partial [Ectocarpus sp. 12 AP-2014]